VRNAEMSKFIYLLISKLLFIMKTLDISAYGVEEMNKQEMMMVEGGCPFLIALAVVAVCVVVGTLASSGF
jgi:lactobin A/cerein 7B family class IIb bacteriocin